MENKYLKYQFILENPDNNFTKKEKDVLINIIENGFKPNIYPAELIDAINKIELIKKYPKINDEILNKYLITDIDMTQLNCILYTLDKYPEYIKHLALIKSKSYIFNGESMYYIVKMIKSGLEIEKIQHLSLIGKNIKSNIYLKTLYRNLNKIKCLDEKTFNKILKRFNNIPYGIKNEKTLLNILNEELELCSIDDFVLRQVDLINIFSEYPNNIKIVYICPNNELVTVHWSKEMMTDIKISNYLKNIPINAIQFIEADGNIVFNNKDYKKDRRTRIEIIEEYIKGGNIINLNPGDYNNDKIMKLAISINEKNLSMASKELKENTKFLLDSMDLIKDKKYNIIYNTTLYKEDKMFLLAFLDKCSDTLKNAPDHWYIDFLNEIPTKFFDEELIYKLTKYCDTNNNNLLKYIPRDLLNKPQIIKNIKDNGKLKNDDYILEKLQYFNKENLLDVFYKRDLCGLVCYLNENALNDKIFIKQLLRDNNICCFTNDRLLKVYQNDNEILTQIAIKVNNTKNASLFLKYLNLENDIEKIFEFASINSNFIDMLNAEEKEIFIIDEMKNIELYELNKNTYYTFNLFTRSGKIEISFDDEEVLVYFIDDYQNKYEFDDTQANMIIKLAENYLINEIPELISTNIFDMFNEIYYMIKSLDDIM